MERTIEAAKSKGTRIPPSDPTVPRTAKSRKAHVSDRDITAAERRWLLGQVSSTAVFEAAPREIPVHRSEPAPVLPARPTPSGSNYRVVLACTSRSKLSPKDTS